MVADGDINESNIHTILLSVNGNTGRGAMVLWPEAHTLIS